MNDKASKLANLPLYSFDHPSTLPLSPQPHNLTELGYNQSSQVAIAGPGHNQLQPRITLKVREDASQVAGL